MASRSTPFRQFVLKVHSRCDLACDHCYICDTLGICCSAIPVEQRARLEAGQAAQPDVLHAAIVQEAWQTNRTIRAVAEERSGLPPEKLSQLLDPASQVGD